MLQIKRIRMYQHAGKVKEGPSTPRKPRLGNTLETSVWSARAAPLTTNMKIHVLIDANGLPVVLKSPKEQANDGRSATNMLDDVSSGLNLLADRAYDSNALRDAIQARGTWANDKLMQNRLGPLAFSPFVYRYRNLVEQFFIKAEALSSDCHPIRPTRRQLPCRRQAYLSPDLVEAL